MVWTVIGGFALIALMDLSPLIRRRKWRAVAAFACVFAAALTLAVLAVLHIEVPSAMRAWGDLVKWLGMGYAA
jgi:membrane-associated PAP2 superfamily phosphatase